MEDTVQDSEFIKEIGKSEDVVSNLLEDCIDMVLNVQVANDMREIKRRDEESKLGELRRLFLEEELKKSEEKIHEIDSKWESIAALNDSVDLYNAYRSQKEKYLKLIQQKQEVINDLKKELSEADTKYVQAQQIHKEDINITVKRIDEHVEIMRNAYRKHLQLIENTAEQEESLILHTKQTEWQNMNEVFEHEKVNEMNKIFTKVEENETNSMSIIWDHYEKYRDMKKSLENELQTLQIKLQETKTHCMLEEKKLEYNYLVLTKRQDELGQIKARQRRKINRLQDEQNNLDNERVEIETNHKSTCAKLEIEISKFTADIETVQQKMHRITDANEHTFTQIWKLNEKRIRSLFDKIFKMDKQLTEQVLRTKWTPTSISFMDISQLPSVKQFMNQVSVEKTKITSSHKESLKYPSQLSPESHVLKFILNNIFENIKFVISEKVDFLIKDLDEERKMLVRFDNILKILDIKNDMELESLKTYFVPYIDCLTCKKSKRRLPLIPQPKYYQMLESKKRTGSGTKIKGKVNPDLRRPSSTSCILDHSAITVNKRKLCDNVTHSWYMDQCSMIKALACFMKEKKQRERQNFNAECKNVPLSRILSPTDIEFYWNSFRPKNIGELKHFWIMLHDPLKEYVKLSKDQSILRQEIDNLTKQNSELRSALRNFMKNDCGLEDKKIHNSTFF